jgi:histone-lysine N-methyltransferase SETMAR
VLRTNIDATSCGNVSRFINHSCSPTLRLDAIRTEQHVIPELVFFTRRALGVGEELTFDYGGSSFDTAEGNGDDDGRVGSSRTKRGAEGLGPGAAQSKGQREDGSEQASKKRKRCQCGAANCRGWLPFDPTA